MDEAERCHEISTIAYGRLIAKGTTGTSSRRMSGYLVGRGPDSISLAGAATSSWRQTRWRRQRAPCLQARCGGIGTEHAHRARADLHWQRSRPSLEDIFIQLMADIDRNNGVPPHRAKTP
jgi:ABC-2 type transport system ATP-binding protein